MSKQRYCPGCKADLRGVPIPEKYFEHDLDSEAHRQSAESCQRWNSPGNNAAGCFCLPYGDLPPEERFYSRIIGVEISGVYDGTLFWQCPDCGGQWHRWELADMRAIAARHMTNPIIVSAA